MWLQPFIRSIIGRSYYSSTGASMTMATNTGIITEVFPMSERGRALDPSVLLSL